MTSNSEEQFEAVYYSEPVPSSFRTLAVLALVFDRVHFPGVYIAENADRSGTADELDRIALLPRRHEVEDRQLMNCMIYAINRDAISDFCVFTGKPGYPGLLEEGTKDLVREFELAIYGPPPENFFPSYNLGFAKGLPGPQDSAVNGPSWLSYPPNALLYSAKHGLPLINDNPTLPVLGLPIEAKANAKALSTVLALEAVQLVLPALPNLSFDDVAELRAETHDDVRPFRRAMLRLSKELDAAIRAEASTAEIQKAARFLVETTVMPELQDLHEVLGTPQRPWYRRTMDVAKSIPEIVANFATLPTAMASAKLLATLGSVLVDVRDDQLAAQKAAKRGGFQYLLRVGELANRKAG